MIDRTVRSVRTAGTVGYPQLAADQLTGPFGYFGPLFDPDPPAQGGGVQGTGNDPAASFQRLLDKKNGDGIALASQLFDENYQYRRQNEELRRQIPAQGAVVLTPEQAAEWTAFQALGKAEDLKQAITERDSLRTERDTLRKQTTIAAAAGVAKFDADVLADLGANLEYEVRDVTAADGKTVEKVAYVKDGDVFKPLKEFAAAKWPKYMLALQQPAQGGQPQEQGVGGLAADPFAALLTSQQGQQQGADPLGGQQQGMQGVPFIEQLGGAGGKAPEAALLEYAKTFQQQRDQAYNPLAPQQEKK